MQLLRHKRFSNILVQRLYSARVASWPHPYSLSSSAMVSSHNLMMQMRMDSTSPGAPVPTRIDTPLQDYVPVVPTAGQGPGGILTAPTTELTNKCNMLSECLTKADELNQQLRAQQHGDSNAQIMTQEGIDEYMEELKSTAQQEMASTAIQLREDKKLIQQAGMHELRRTLYYAGQLHAKEWVEKPHYLTTMRALTVEFLRRDHEGALTPDDVLYVTTHIVVSNFYNRHLWNKMENSLFRFKNFENIDIATIKGLTTKLFKSRPGAAKETLDIRRKVLNAMAKRVGTLANDFDLPSLLGILQCYTVHGLLPRWCEPLAHRCINHISDYTPQECATICQVLRRWKLMRLEVAEKLLERICTAENITFSMATAALQSLRTCFSRIAEGGRAAANAEATKQKVRAMGEQIGCRLDEVQYPSIPVMLVILDIVITIKIYVPKKCLQNIFQQANEMVTAMVEGKELIDEKTNKSYRSITAEEARQLQALLYHYGTELSPDLNVKLRQALKDGVFPDEASMF